jgi:uncharacterized protein YqgV (UPF0045/DUF77 family)
VVAIMAISVTSVGTGSTGVGEFVATALGVIERSGLRNRRDAPSTIEAKVRSVRARMARP